MSNQRKVKIKAKPAKFDVLLMFFNTVVDMANSMYWLHPECADLEDFLESVVKVKYPQFDWYICMRSKQLKINV